MKLIVGLGNPGEKYLNTRHNVGFRTVDFLAEKLGINQFQEEKKFKSKIASTKIGNETVILVKPETFMNSSGEAISQLSEYYKINKEDVWVIADELDLPLGTMRVKPDTTTSTHNGIKSIIERIGHEFIRFRVGISSDSIVSAENFVLDKFSKSEQQLIGKIIEQTVQAIIKFISESKIKPMTIDLRDEIR